MKYITLSILLLSFSSCYKSECGGNVPLKIVYKGFNEPELFSAKMYQYVKGSNYTTLLDSVTGYKNRISDLDFDYKIIINTQEVKISNLNKLNISQKKFGFVKTKEMLVCPLDDNFLVLGTNAYQQGDTVFISK